MWKGSVLVITHTHTHPSLALSHLWLPPAWQSPSWKMSVASTFQRCESSVPLTPLKLGLSLPLHPCSGTVRTLGTSPMSFPPDFLSPLTWAPAALIPCLWYLSLCSSSLHCLLKWVRLLIHFWGAVDCQGRMPSQPHTASGNALAIDLLRTQD